MQLITVEQRVQRLEERWKEQEDAQVEAIRKVIDAAFQNGRGLEERWTAFKRRVSDARLTAQLTDAALPESTETGLNFIDQLTQIAKETLLAQADHATKGIFSKIIERIGNTIQSVQENPVLKAVLTVSPVAKMVDMVLGAAQAFVENKTRVITRGVKAELAFADEALKAFKDRLDPYVRYFGTLDSASQEYGLALAAIIQQVNALAVDLDTWYERFRTALGLGENGGVEEFVALFQDREAAEVLADPRVQNGCREAQAFSSFVQQLASVEAAYDNAWISFLKKYKAGLEAVAQLAGFNTVRVRALIERINDRVQHVGGDHRDQPRLNDGFADPPRSLVAMRTVHDSLRRNALWV